MSIYRRLNFIDRMVNDNIDYHDRRSCCDKTLVVLSLCQVCYGAASSSPVNYYTQLIGFILQYSSEEEEVDLQTALTGFQTKQRKVLEPVDHAKIQYEAYRKNFYVEVPELAKMSQDGE